MAHMMISSDEDIDSTDEESDNTESPHRTAPTVLRNLDPPSDDWIPNDPTEADVESEMEGIMQALYTCNLLQMHFETLDIDATPENNLPTCLGPEHRVAHSCFDCGAVPAGSCAGCKSLWCILHMRCIGIGPGPVSLWHCWNCQWPKRFSY